MKSVKYSILTIFVILSVCGCSGQQEPVTEAAAESPAAETAAEIVNVPETTVPETTVPETTMPETTPEETTPAATEPETEPVPEKTEYRFLFNIHELPSECFTEEPYENYEGTDAYYIIDKAYITAHFDELKRKDQSFIDIVSKMKAPEGAVSAIHQNGRENPSFEVKDGYITAGTGIEKKEDGSLTYYEQSPLFLIWYDASGEPMNQDPETLTVNILDAEKAAMYERVKNGNYRFLLNLGNLPDNCFQEPPSEIEGENTAVYEIDYEYVLEHFDELAEKSEEAAVILQSRIKVPEGAVRGVHINGHEDPEFDVHDGFISTGTRIRKNENDELELHSEILHMLWFNANEEMMNATPEDLVIRLNEPTVYPNAKHLDKRCFAEPPMVEEDERKIEVTYRIDRKFVESHYDELSSNGSLGATVEFAAPEEAALFYNVFDRIPLGTDNRWMRFEGTFTTNGKVADRRSYYRAFNYQDKDGNWISTKKVILHFIADDAPAIEVIHPKKEDLTPGLTGYAGKGEAFKEGERRVLPADYFTRPAEYDEEAGIMDLWISEERLKQAENRFYDNTVSVTYRYPDDWEILNVEAESYNYNKETHEVWTDVHILESIGEHGGWQLYYAFINDQIPEETPSFTFRKPDGTIVDVAYTIRYHKEPGK